MRGRFVVPPSVRRERRRSIYDPRVAQQQQSARITAGDVSAGLALAEPEPARDGTDMAVTLDFMDREPSGLGKVFGSKGVGLSVQVHEFVAGGPHYYFTDVRFPRRVDIQQSFARTGLEWPVWWVVPEVSHLVDRMGTRMLSVAGFARPEYALPWFVRLHSVVADTDPYEPVLVRRGVSRISGGAGVHGGIESLWDMLYEVAQEMRREATHESLQREAYEGWLEREAAWKQSGQHG